MILLVNLCILFKTTWICIIIIAIQWNKCIHTMGINFRIANLSLNFFSVKYFTVSMTPNWWNTEGQSKNKTKKKAKNLKWKPKMHTDNTFESILPKLSRKPSTSKSDSSFKSFIFYQVKFQVPWVAIWYVLETLWSLCISSYVYTYKTDDNM